MSTNRRPAEDSLGRYELYVYYKLPVEAATGARAELEALWPALQASCPGLESRWLQRPEIRDGILTWMEVHRHAQGLSAAEVAHIGELMSPWPRQRVGPRHVELFEPMGMGSFRSTRSLGSTPD